MNQQPQHQGAAPGGPNWWQRRGTVTRVLIVGFVAVCLIIIAVDLVSGSAKTTPTTARSTATTSGVADHSPEWILAYIYSDDASLREDEAIVRKFSTYLDSLEGKTTYNRSRIADVIAATWQEVQDRGYSDSILRVAQELNTSIPAGVTLDLAEVAAAWVIIRTSE